MSPIFESGLLVYPADVAFLPQISQALGEAFGVSLTHQNLALLTFMEGETTPQFHQIAWCADDGTEVVVFGGHAKANDPEASTSDLRLQAQRFADKFPGISVYTLFVAEDLEQLGLTPIEPHKALHMFDAN